MSVKTPRYALPLALVAACSAPSPLSPERPGPEPNASAVDPKLAPPLPSSPATAAAPRTVEQRTPTAVPTVQSSASSAPSAVPPPAATATAPPPPTNSPPASTPAQWAGGFAAYPGARELCWQTITGTAGHIRFTTYVTADPTTKVAKYYQPQPAAADAGSQQPVGDAVVQLQKAGGYLLEVYPRTGRYPSCGRFLGPQDQTVIIVSQGVF